MSTGGTTAESTAQNTVADLTEEQAYEAMFIFLERHYELTGSDDIGSLLGSMRVLEDGGTADPALRDDWQESVEQVLEQRSPD